MGDGGRPDAGAEGPCAPGLLALCSHPRARAAAATSGGLGWRQPLARIQELRAWSSPRVPRRARDRAGRRLLTPSSSPRRRSDWRVGGLRGKRRSKRSSLTSWIAGPAPGPPRSPRPARPPHRACPHQGTAHGDGGPGSAWRGRGHAEDKVLIKGATWGGWPLTPATQGRVQGLSRGTAGSEGARGCPVRSAREVRAGKAPLQAPRPAAVRPGQPHTLVAPAKGKQKQESEFLGG